MLSLLLEKLYNNYSTVKFGGHLWKIICYEYEVTVCLNLKSLNLMLVLEAKHIYKTVIFSRAFQLDGNLKVLLLANWQLKVVGNSQQAVLLVVNVTFRIN